MDRRRHADDWCNQAGAGSGERPRSAPEPGVDAYVRVKPPGECDGAALPTGVPDGKGFDRMRTPGDVHEGAGDRSHRSGALPDGPLAGARFPAQLAQLLANAHPRP